MPESLYFFTADMFHLYKFIKNGTFVDVDTVPWLLRGAAYDSDTLGGGYVWWSSLDSVDQFKMYDPNAMYFTGTGFGCDYPGSGLGFAQDFRDMDVLFSVINLPEEDYIYGFFLRWSDSTGVMENSYQLGHDCLEIRAPNPIRKGNRIRYLASSSCRVRLKIYDATGRCVISAPVVTLGANNSFVWDGKDRTGRNLPFGVYFLSFEADHGTCLRKLVYIE